MDSVSAWHNISELLPPCSLSIDRKWMITRANNVFYHNWRGGTLFFSSKIYDGIMLGESVLRPQNPLTRSHILSGKENLIHFLGISQNLAAKVTCVTQELELELTNYEVVSGHKSSRKNNGSIFSVFLKFGDKDHMCDAGIENKFNSIYFTLRAFQVAFSQQSQAISYTEWG